MRAARYGIGIARVLWALLCVLPIMAQTGRFVSSDLYKLRSVGTVRLSPDGGKIAYTGDYNERPGKPYSRIQILDVASNRSVTVANPRPIPCGRRTRKSWPIAVKPMAKAAW